MKTNYNLNRLVNFQFIWHQPTSRALDNENSLPLPSTFFQGHN